MSDTLRALGPNLRIDVYEASDRVRGRVRGWAWVMVRVRARARARASSKPQA